MDIRLHTRDDPQWERVVFAEVLVPETPNVFNDYWTREAIKEAAYAFMEQGFGIDIEHDNDDVSDAVKVVEAFIARDGDPDFIAGSWVVAMRINDDAIWQGVLDGDINGYSYEALVSMLPATFSLLDDGVRMGVTEPDVDDGHVHEFVVFVNETNRPVGGGTTDTNGHEHSISTSTVTDVAAGHVHRYNLVQGKGGK
jgi:Putative phage serine protease XkdF